MKSKLIPLDEQPDIKDLLIGFALFALNYERLVDRLQELAKNLGEPATNNERTGGGWIELVSNLLRNNAGLDDNDSQIAESFIKGLWELNVRRIELLKGVKYFHAASGDRPASFINYERDGAIPKPTTNIYTDTVYRLLDDCKYLEEATGFFTECIVKKVKITDVISEEDGKYTFNLNYLR